jgi:septal ring factor EnvC (AmiA/AmiB activator)
MGRVGKATETTGRSLGRQESEWTAAIGDLQKKATRERSEVSGLKEALAKLEGKHEKLQETVARQGDDLAETRRRNSELGGRAAAGRRESAASGIERRSEGPTDSSRDEAGRL